MSTLVQKNTAYKHPRRRVWLFAVVGALLLQSLFPSGYMPANLADGWVAALCPEGLPDAFVQQLAGTGLHSNHHAHHIVGEADGPSGDATMSMGSCELGSALDQSFDVTESSVAVAHYHIVPIVPTPELVWVAANAIHFARSRAPPTS